MRSVDPPEPRDVPRWLLWLVTCVCFGPLTAVLALGVLMVPLWTVMFVMGLADPERFADAAGTSVWVAFWPICYVLGGLVGLAGLLRVLAPSRRARPERHRVLTLAMIGIGFAALAMFNVPFLTGPWDFAGGFLDAGLAIYVVLPFGGGAWLLAKSWTFLIAPRDVKPRARTRS